MATQGTRDWLASIGEGLKTSIADPDALDSLPPPEQQELSVDREQVIALARADLNMLAGLAVPHMFKYAFPPILLAAWMLLTQTVIKPRDFAQIALGIPRGFGKTTLTKLFILWVILFTNKKYIIVIASTAFKAENIIADVMKMLSQRNIVSVFGDWSLGKDKDTQELKKFGFRGRNIILHGIGVNGDIRGTNINDERPELMIFEDIQTADDAKSATISEAIETWMVGTAMKAKSPHGCMFIFNGNMYPGPNSILKHIKTNKSWVKFISGAILADGSSLWPEHRSIEELLAELDNDIASGHPEVFFAEVMNDTEAGINTSVDLSKIKKWPYVNNELPQGKCVIIDPASGRTQASANNRRGIDPTTIAVMEVYDETPCFTYLFEDNLSPGNTIRKALLLCLQQGIKVICVESTSYQATLCYWFDIECERLGITGIQALPVGTGVKSKNSRIAVTLQSLQAGEIIIHDIIRSQVTSQITNWNPMKRDNDDGILDCLSHGKKCIELYGPLMLTNEELEVSAINDEIVDEEALPF